MGRALPGSRCPALCRSPGSGPEDLGGLARIPAPEHERVGGQRKDVDRTGDDSSTIVSRPFSYRQRRTSGVVFDDVITSVLSKGKGRGTPPINSLISPTNGEHTQDSRVRVASPDWSGGGLMNRAAAGTRASMRGSSAGRTPGTAPDSVHTGSAPPRRTARQR